MIREINSKTYFRKNRKHIDDWFCGSYGFAPYYGCLHACVYCDGRYEKYGFEGEFGEDVDIKANAIELLNKEIKSVKEPGYCFIGSGITDAYQLLENKYKLTRRSLEIVKDNPLLSLHILTKSALVERDFDILEEVAKKRKSIISYSVAFDNEENRKKLEPRTAPLSERWRILKKAKSLGINTGVYIIPSIPFISDSEKEIEGIVKKCVDAEVDFVLFGGMTLKNGRQKDFYLEFIKKEYPDLYDKTVDLYSNANHYGSPKYDYSLELNKRFSKLARKYKLNIRMPQYLLKSVMPMYYEVALVLSHMKTYLQMRGISRKAYMYAGISIQKWIYEQKKGKIRRKDFNYNDIEKQFEEIVMDGSVKKLGSVGDTIYKMLKEFVESGRISYYDKLVGYK